MLSERENIQATEYGKICNTFSKDNLVDLCIEKVGVQTGPFGSQLHKEDYVTEGTPIITVEHLGENYILHQNTPFVSDFDKERLSKYHLQEGDIVFSRVGSVDRRALVREVEDGWLFSGRCLRVRVDKKKVDPTYLSYFFGLESFKEYIRRIAVGATMPSINTKILSKVPIYYPDLSTQRAIAHILGSLDDKIELNRKMNETLEAMAQALFKSWFVDFDPVIDNALAAGKPIPAELQAKAEVRKKKLEEKYGTLAAARQALVDSIFPSEFIETEELGPIPKDWKVISLIEILQLIGGGTPKTSISEYWEGDIPWFSVVDAPNNSDVFVINTEKHISELGLNNSSTKLLSPGTTIISARGTVGKCAMVGESMAMNQSCYGIKGKSGVSDCFVYYIVRESVGDLQRGGHGSVFNTITRDTFKTVKIPFGDGSLTVLFEKQIKSNFNKIRSNLQQIHELSKLRDTLLPKLLSGKIWIKDAEKLVGTQCE